MVPLLSEAVITKAFPAARVVLAFRAMVDPLLVLPIAMVEAAVLDVPMFTEAVPEVKAFATLTVAVPVVTLLARLTVSAVVVARPMLTVVAALVEPTFTSAEVTATPPLPALRVKLEAPLVLPTLTVDRPVLELAMLIVAVPVVSA